MCECVMSVQPWAFSKSRPLTRGYSPAGKAESVDARAEISKRNKRKGKIEDDIRYLQNWRTAVSVSRRLQTFLPCKSKHTGLVTWIAENSLFTYILSHFNSTQWSARGMHNDWEGLRALKEHIWMADCPYRTYYSKNKKDYNLAPRVKREESEPSSSWVMKREWGFVGTKWMVMSSGSTVINYGITKKFTIYMLRV